MNANKDHYIKLTQAFTDLVCLMAYMFRVRGHHYLDDMNETYTKLWDKIKTDGFALAGTFQYLMTTGLHAILPDNLDAFYWAACAQNTISHVLFLRLNAPCAGTAAFFAVQAGWRDVETLYAVLLADYSKESRQLRNQMRILKTHRWAHGINASMYGADPSRMDTAQLGTLAAIIVGIYQENAPEATLLKALSMVREASNHPLILDYLKGSSRRLRRRLIEESTAVKTPEQREREERRRGQRQDFDDTDEFSEDER